MDAVYPNGNFIPFMGASAPAYVTGIPFRGVLHTTQSKDYHPSATSYYGHTNPPHFTIVKKDEVKVFQHFSIKVGARALANLSGGVQTNRNRAIQIEIAWYAEEIADLPNDMVAGLKDLMRWIEAQAGVKRKSLKFYDEADAEGTGAESRMEFQEWLNFEGWCGHQHVPENAHWDPGLIDIKRLLKTTG